MGCEHTVGIGRGLALILSDYFLYLGSYGGLHFLGLGVTLFFFNKFER